MEEGLCIICKRIIIMLLIKNASRDQEYVEVAVVISYTYLFVAKLGDDTMYSMWHRDKSDDWRYMYTIKGGIKDETISRSFWM